MQRVLLAAASIALLPSSAGAVQTHAGAEGLVSHQLGHALFAVGMTYLLLRLRRLRFFGPGWLEFKSFLALLIAWNLVTFTGHWLNGFMADDQFVKNSTHIISFTIDSFSTALFYLSRLDHLLLVPSFAFLLLALNKWRLQP